MHRFTVHLAAGVALVMLTSAAFATDRPSTPSTPATSSTQGQSAMRVYVDPETNTLVDRPVTPEQRAVAEKTQASFSQSSDGLVETIYPDGSKGVDLQGRFEQATTAVRTPDGGLKMDCNDARHGALGAHTHDAAGKAVPVAEPRDDR